MNNLENTKDYTKLTLYKEDGFEIVIDEKTGECFASTSAVARMCNVNESSIRKFIKGAELITIKEAKVNTPGGLQKVVLLTEESIILCIAKYNPNFLIMLINKGWDVDCVAIFEKTRAFNKIKKIPIVSEKEYTEYLNTFYNGELEVATPCGRIDILTNTELIEVKKGKNYKSAVGQLLFYSLSFPNHKKVLHLFDVPLSIDLDLINCKLNKINIELRLPSYFN